MDAAVFGYIEATLVFVIVVGWGARELWLLKRDRDARRQDGADQSAESRNEERG